MRAGSKREYAADAVREESVREPIKADFSKLPSKREMRVRRKAANLSRWVKPQG